MIRPEVAAVAVAFALSLSLSPLARRLAVTVGHIDVPNERSSHREPTPKSGGVAIIVALLGAAAASAVARDGALVAVLAGTVVLCATALVDEYRALPRVFRFIVQIAVSSAVVLAADLAAAPSAVGLGPLAPVLAVLWLVGFVNVYNFMDGANGLASMQAVVGGIALALLLAPSDDPATQLALALAGAAAGFLPWNFPRASIFMGDTGSNAFGFLFAALVLRAAGSVPFAAAALPFAPFLLDSTVTVAIRAARHEAFFSTPHRIHFYQRLLDRGWSHALVTTLWSALAALSAAAALAYPGLDAGGRAVALVAILAIHGAVAAAIVSSPRFATSGL